MLTDIWTTRSWEPSSMRSPSSRGASRFTASSRRMRSPLRTMVVPFVER
jgi:hypothetical protein